MTRTTAEPTPLVSARDPFSLGETDRTPLLSGSVHSLLAECTAPNTFISRDDLRRFAERLTQARWGDGVSGGVGAALMLWALALPSPPTSDPVKHPTHRTIGTTEDVGDVDSKQVTARLALTAVDDLVNWLQEPEQDVAKLAGFSRRNISNWRNGRGVYPKTVRALFEIHALVGGLVRSLGSSGATSWLSQRGRGDLKRRALLSSEAGRVELQRSASALIFERVQVETAAAEFEESELEADLVAAPQPDQFGQPVTRRRRKTE